MSTNIGQILFGCGRTTNNTHGLIQGKMATRMVKTHSIDICVLISATSITKVPM